MTFKEYIEWNPSIHIDFHLDDELTEEEIKKYYDMIRKELLDGKYTLQNNEEM